MLLNNITDTPKHVISTCIKWLLYSWSLGEIKAILILLACVQGSLSGWKSTETVVGNYFWQTNEQKHRQLWEGGKV